MNTPAAPSPVLADWLDQAARQSPGAIALQGAGGRCRYQDLAHLAERVAGELAKRLTGRGPVATALTSRWRTALLVYGTARLGVPLLPLDPRMPLDLRDRLLAQAGAGVLVGEGAPTGLAPGIAPVSADWLDAPGPAAPGVLPPPRAGVRLIVPTSGSTGEPRGVMLSDANLMAAVAAARRRMPLGPGDCWLGCLPLWHIGGLAILYRCLEAGARVWLHEGFDAGRVWRDLAGEGVTHLSLVPAMLHQLLEVSGEQPPPLGLRAVLVGGAALTPALAGRARRAGWPLCVSYGMSEAASQIATDCGPEAGLVQGRVGRPLEGFEWAIDAVDASGVGRIRVRGPALMLGYVNPALEPGQGLREGWLETGDLGRLDRDGDLVVLGRADERVNSGGEKVHAAQVEPLLRDCPGIGEVAVLAQVDPVWGARLAAVYTGTLTPAQLDDWCRRHLAGPWRPRVFLRVARLPHGSGGKLDRARLLEWLAADPAS